MAELTPGILEKNFEAIQEKISAVDTFVNAVHLDVMDGKFVSNSTFQEGTRLPDLITEAVIDVHLMVANPEEVIMQWSQPNVRRLIIHEEVCGEKKNCPPLLNTIQMIRDYEKEVGVALNPETPVTTIKQHLDSIDFVLIMTVNPGFGGQDFMPAPLAKITELRALKPSLKIGVDGGVNEQTISQVHTAGADLVVANSAIYKAASIPTAIEALKKLISK